MDKSNPSDEADKVEWTEDHENILVEWADKAMCYSGYMRNHMLSFHMQMPGIPYLLL